MSLGAEAERIELPRPVKAITVFKTDKHANLASLQMLPCHVQ